MWVQESLILIIGPVVEWQWETGFQASEQWIDRHESGTRPLDPNSITRCLTSKRPRGTERKQVILSNNIHLIMYLLTKVKAKNWQKIISPMIRYFLCQKLL